MIFSHRFHRSAQIVRVRIPPTDFTDLHRLLGCAPIRSGGESLRSKQQYISYKRTRSKRYINIARLVHLRQVHPLKLASVLSGICGRIFSAVCSVISVYSVGGSSQAAASVKICDICGSFSVRSQCVLSAFSVRSQRVFPCKTP